jgi:hypothetical protein
MYFIRREDDQVVKLLGDCRLILEFMAANSLVPITRCCTSVYVGIVCEPIHISPYDAHFRIALVIVNKIFYRSFCQEIIDDAMV